MSVRQDRPVDTLSRSHSTSTWPLPQSPLYTLQFTPGAGRSVIARVSIPADTLVLSTSEPLSPIAHTIFRPYRREVCAWCFAYDRGRTLSHRHHLSSAGVIFCSDACSTLWLVSVGQDGLAAYQELENHERKISRARPSVPQSTIENDSSSFTNTSPSKSDIDSLVSTFEIFGENAKRVRQGLTPVRDRKLTQRTLSAHRPDLDVDNLRLLLSAVLHSHDASTIQPAVPKGSEISSPSHVARTWLPPSLTALAEDERVYKTREALVENLESYVELIARLPFTLLASLSATLCHEVVSRAAHNAFSIRPAGDSDGEQSGEFLGWGIWPEASFFNHSCAPNLRKLRDGRVWSFRTDRAISAGEELCITYLGGDENSLSLSERHMRLHDNWGFVCRCTRCTQDSNGEAHDSRRDPS